MMWNIKKIGQLSGERWDTSQYYEIVKATELWPEYQNLIESSIDKVGRPSSICSKLDGYEIHHIIPRSFGGIDDKFNLCYLTPYEHILAHYYLAVMTKNVHMMLAFRLMVQTDFDIILTDERKRLKRLEYWGKVRELARRRMFTEEARQTISSKAKERWSNWKKTGQVEEIKKNIARTTKEGMANSIKSQIRTRVNLGCKKYWNPETGERRNWYPGMPEFKEPWIRGRGPLLSEESRKKLSETLKKDPHKWYHNDELKLNRTFKQSEIVPDGWIPGIKKEYEGNYAKIKRQLKEDKLQELQSTHQ